MPAGRSYERRIRAKRDAARAARKHQERVRKLRIGLSAAAAVGVAIVLLVVFLTNGKPVKPTAGPTSSPSPTASPIAGCTEPSPVPTPNGKQFAKPPKMTIDKTKVYIATMQTSCGDIKIKLDPKLAPTTVNNFVFLANQHFFDGTVFHRVQNIPGDYAIVQGGDPQGTGSGGPGYKYKGETPPATAQYSRGVIAMANSGDPSSNGSQFFFVVHAWPALPKNYTIFGNVDDATSLAALDRMITAKGPDLGQGLGLKPTPPIFILKVTVQVLKAG